MSRGILNPRARQTDSRGLFSTDDYARLRAFYDARPWLTATPLRRLPQRATQLGIGELLVKDESQRFGLNAFKALGVRFAVEQMAAGADLGTLTCATAGNHGRAVAHVARELGLAARIYVPAYTEPNRIQLIASEGADVVLFDGTYDEAVRACAADAARDGWTIVSDTGWSGYETIPRAIMLGYTRLLDECVKSGQTSFSPASVVIVQAGVGGLAAALLSWLAFHFGDRRPFTLIAEPASAPCVMAAIEAGRPLAVSGPLDTIMAGLRCAEVSTAAWPALMLADGCVTIDDPTALEAVQTFATPVGGDERVSAGPSGACGLGALLSLLGDKSLESIRHGAGLGGESQVILINTEGGLECGTPPSH